MSYLNPLRLHFAGSFQAAPSTVNNDPTHFDNRHFLPSYQKFGEHGTNGWWNPRGDADVRLIGCQVTSAWQDGKPVSGDSILQCSIADSNTRVAAKLVDLDPEQQMVSEIWGLEVRICTADGTTLVKGHFQPAAFGDIWARFPTGNPDSCYSAIYQSVLVNLEWPDVSGSPFLTALKAASARPALHQVQRRRLRRRPDVGDVYPGAHRRHDRAGGGRRARAPRPRSPLSPHWPESVERLRGCRG